MPGERSQLLLAHLYARNGSGALALGTGSDLDTLLTALTHHGVPAQRTRELRDLVMRSTSNDDGQLLALIADPTRRLLIKALRDPRCLDVELIDHLTASVSEVDRQISSVPFVRLQLLLAPVVELCLRLQDTEPLRARLSALRCDAYLLAGRIAFETRDDAGARRWYTRGVAASDDPTRRAVARTSYGMTVLHSTGDGAARSIVDAAVADAKLSSDLRVRARAYALQAEVAARSGRFRDAVAALRLAWLDLESTGADGGGFNDGRLRGFEGVCELHAGTPERTESFVTELDDHIYDAFMAR